MIEPKHVPRYLADSEYRFNRRYDLATILPRLTWACSRTPPMPYRLLKLPDSDGSVLLTLNVRPGGNVSQLMLGLSAHQVLD